VCILIDYFYPDSVIVIQGLLPRTNNEDGSLLSDDSSGNRNRPKNQNAAFKRYSLWPSIVTINKQLEEFCSKHEHLVYFDAARLFVKDDYIRSELMMKDFVRLSALGYTVLGNHMVKELQHIIYDDGEENDFETPDTRP
jgi:hypothetical protein